MSLAEDIPAAPRFESARAFLLWAAAQPERWELIGGEAVAMTGGSLNHSRIARNALVMLQSCLRAGCEAFGSDAAVVLDETRVAFPDVSVSCGGADGPETGMDVARPVVVVEVLSPSTAAYDLGAKAEAYRRLPSLRHLAFLHGDRIAAQHFHRAAAGDEFALTEIARVDGRLALDAVGVEIVMAELYAQVVLAG